MGLSQPADPGSIPAQVGIVMGRASAAETCPHTVITMRFGVKGLVLA